MPSDAAKKKQQAKKAAAASKRGGAAADKNAAATNKDDYAPAQGTIHRLRFPPSLTARQRAIIHEIAEEHGLSHASTGEDAARHIRVWTEDDTGEELVVTGEDDDAICSAMRKLLGEDVSARFREAATAPGGRSQAGGPASNAAAAEKMYKTLGGAASKPLTLEEFISRTLPLIDMEKDAEMAASQETTSQLSPEAAQKRGRALLNLKCTDLQTGLLGKTLLTLEPNRGDLLPAHKLTPHDVVSVRPNRSLDTSPAAVLAQGVVYRLKESLVVVAVDDIPESGLDVPLRLDKLANDVTYKRLKATVAALSKGVISGPAANLVPILFHQRPPAATLPSSAASCKGHDAAAHKGHDAASCSGHDGGSVKGNDVGAGAGHEHQRSTEGHDHRASSISVSSGAGHDHHRGSSTSSGSMTSSPSDFGGAFNRDLDASQKRAVARALASRDVALLHGPPGTGKTTAVVELILQEVKRGTRVLACAASNIAVDNMVERLAAHKCNAVRLGHPARLLPSVLDRSLDALVLRSDNTALARDVRREIKALNESLFKTRDRALKSQMRRELKALTKEEVQRERQAVVDVIKGADVVLTTLTGSLGSQLADETFDLVVIDEAAQALEAACWQALLKGRRCVLAGDHLQLPPTCQSDEAAKKGLGVTLFERVAAGPYGRDVTSMLTVQYRMHEDIMNWSSGELYGGLISAHGSVARHRLSDLDYIGPSGHKHRKSVAIAPGGGKEDGQGGDDHGGGDSNVLDEVLVLIDTAGCDDQETKEADGDSTYNAEEARVAMAHVGRLLAAGVAPGHIGVITPYNAQVQLLRELRQGLPKIQHSSGGKGGGAAAAGSTGDAVEISTVDGFQGREKEAIVISMVRSNDKGEVGFLADARRMNVAVTRARRHCAVVCDTETVSKDPFLKRMVAYFEEHGLYRGAMEYGS
eukprot:jgi/Mesvir1/8682/Mv26108-RA.1